MKLKNTLDRALKFSYDIDLPIPYMKNKAPIFFQDAYQYPIPDVETSYTKNIENMPELINIISEQLNQSPNQSISIILNEKVNIDGIKRDIEINGQIPKKFENSVLNFKDDLFSTLTSTKSFYDINDEKCWKIENLPGKGNKFESPKVYDINGNESIINLNGNNYDGVFIYDDEKDFELFKNNIKNLNIICICKTNSFFQRKKKLINEGCLNQYPHYFVNGKNEDFKNLDLPKIIIVNERGIVYLNYKLDKEKIKDFENNIIYSNDGKSENLNEWLFNGDNEQKLNVVRKINLYLRNKGYNNVNFSLNSKSIIQKNNNIIRETVPTFTGVVPMNMKEDYEKIIREISRDLQFENSLNNVKYQ